MVMACALEVICESLSDYINRDEYRDDDISLPNPLLKSGCKVARERGYYNQKAVHYPSSRVKDWWEGVSLVKEVLEMGYSDRKPCRVDMVTINYLIQLMDGRSVDWSRRPYKFTVGDSSTMEGLTKGILGMRVGEKSKLYIPFGMAYGWKSSLLSIPEASDIVMTVRLLGIKG